MPYEPFSGMSTFIVLILITLGLVLVSTSHKRKYYRIKNEHSGTMYLCGESEEVVFKRANYDISSMLMNIMGLKKIRSMEIRELNNMLVLYIFAIALASLLVVLWISLRGL